MDKKKQPMELPEVETYEQDDLVVELAFTGGAGNDSDTPA